MDKRCRAVIATPWMQLGYPAELGMWEIILEGIAAYEALHRDLKLAFPGHERPRYCGGDTYILARRYRPYDWRHNYKHVSGPSGTWGHLLGRRCWENKDDPADEVLGDDGELMHRQRLVAFVATADRKFDKSEHVPIEAGHIDDEFEFKEGPRCLVEPLIRRPRRAAVGPTVNVIPAEIPFAPNWRDSMADAMRLVPSREKATPFSCEWNTQAAQGGDYVSYSDERRSRMALEKEFPEDAYRWRWRGAERAKIGALMDNARRLARERIVAGIQLKGRSAAGGKSIRRLSQDWMENKLRETAVWVHPYQRSNAPLCLAA